jgi:serine phosphatase RsbU (regulator of sigma subunit)
VTFINPLRQFLITLFVQCCIVFTAAAQPVVHLYDTSGIKVLGRFAALYEDPTGTMTVRQVSSPNLAANFKTGTTDIPNYNVTRSRIWARLHLMNHSPFTRCYLECGNPNVNAVEVYVQESNGNFESTESGFSVLPSMRKVRIHDLLFPLDLPTGSLVTIYVAMWDILPLQVHLNAGHPEQFIETYEARNFMHGAFFGLLFMLVIYNLFIYVSVRDKVYIYYVFYVTANAWFISFLTGYGIHVPGVARVLQFHPALVTYFLGAVSCLFSIVFLDMKRTFYNGYRTTLFMFFLLLTVPGLDLAGFKVESILLVQFYGLSFSIVSFIFGFIIYRRGYRSAKFYILGWSSYLVGLVIHISTDLKLLPFNAFTHNSLEIFTALEAILLSMAVGDKISLFKEEKEQAQHESLEAAKRNEQLVREQNVVLAEKVKERTYELEEQKKIVEEKNKEIVDSINYAKRIQYALLAHEELLKTGIPEHFVFFRPKDIVSGDFYWAADKGDTFWLAVCDSTGHGVPGAFMSLLNISYLNEAVIEKNILSPDKVLDHVRHKLIFNMDQSGGKDGMDGALLKFDKKNKKVTYAAAHNTLLKVSAGIATTFEADKMPIGKGESLKPFTLRDLHLVKGDMLYIYTDGFADQFGGPKGKKFKYRQLDELLTSIASLPLGEQHIKLEREFLEWKSNLEQVDDVCVIGIKV